MSVFFNTMLLKASVTTPAYPSGYVQWLDASDPAGTGTLPSNGSALASWFDKSGNSNTVTQAVGGSQPIFNLNQQNGLPGITLNGTKFMSGTATGFSLGSAARTVFLVFKTATPLPADGSYIYTYGAVDNNNNYLTVIGGSNNIFVAGNFTHNTFTNAAATQGTSYIFEHNYPAAGLMSAQQITINGVLQGVFAFQGSVLTTDAGGSWIGVLPGGSMDSPFIGNINEILVYPRSLTTLEQSTVRSILQTKWGI